MRSRARVSIPANEALARESERLRLDLQEANRRLREATEQFQPPMRERHECCNPQSKTFLGVARRRPEDPAR
jgi:hypothetical protein